ncbi:hypothetical protein KWF73_18335 [Acinetobacter pittii]|uniref:hypothetical protein n=1 Tax=Acinetobacter pittii TaxID=48296 RepID=UPI00355C0D11
MKANALNLTKIRQFIFMSHVLMVIFAIHVVIANYLPVSRETRFILLSISIFGTGMSFGMAIAFYSMKRILERQNN